MNTQSGSTSEHSTMKSTFTATGLPLNHACFGAALAVTTADANNDAGPARRIDCRPTQLLAAPSLRPAALKRAPSPFDAPAPALSLTVGINDSSLISDDEDDDELIDYFGSASARFSRPSASANNTTSSTHWNVRDHDVPTLPSFYPLDQAAAFVPQAKAPIIAARIVSALKARSITATYDSVNAKVDCVSESHVQFRVRLYRGRGEYGHGIIVEVQRREGFDISYAQDVYAVLDAAEGENSTFVR